MLRTSLARHGVGADSGFRWRSREIMRIEGFSDAVFAFAVTLLVVSLEVPRSFGELLHMMQGFVAFALGFALLFIIWYNQYKFFRRYGLEDATTITLNGILLFVVLFFVYPLKFLFTYLVRAFAAGRMDVPLPGAGELPVVGPGDTGLLMIIYGSGYVAVFGIFALLTLHAYGRREMLQLNAVEIFDTLAFLREHCINVLIGLASIVVAVSGGDRAAGWAGLTYMLIGPAMTLHGAVTGRKRRRFERDGGTQAGTPAAGSGGGDA